MKKSIHVHHVKGNRHKKEEQGEERFGISVKRVSNGLVLIEESRLLILPFFCSNIWMGYRFDR